MPPKWLTKKHNDWQAVLIFVFHPHPIITLVFFAFLVTLKAIYCSGDGLGYILDSIYVFLLLYYLNTVIYVMA